MNINNRFNYTFILILFFSVAVILFFSWTSSPKLQSTGLIPIWLTNWTDAPKNDTIRTAIPFLFLGIIIGVYIVLKKIQKKWWYLAVLFCALLVLLAEIGQFFLPQRSFDFKDIFWGIMGNIVGLFMVYLLNKYSLKFNK